MRCRAVFLKLFLFVVCLGLPAVAAQPAAGAVHLEFSALSDHQLKDFLLETEVQKLGNLTMPSGWAEIKGNQIELTTRSSDSFYRQLILKGKLLKTQLQIDRDDFALRGFVYFDAGSWLGYLVDPSAIDVIFLEDGFRRGKIVAVDAQTLSLKQEGRVNQIPWGQVKDLRSGQVYVLKVQGKRRLTVEAALLEGSLSCQLELKETMPLRRLSAQSVIVHPQQVDDEELWEQP